MKKVYVEQKQLDKLISIQKFKQHSTSLQSLLNKVEVDIRKRYTPFNKNNFGQFAKDIHQGMTLITLVGDQLAFDLKYSNLQFIIEPFRKVNRFSASILNTLMLVFEGCYTDYLRILNDFQKVSQSWLPMQFILKDQIKLEEIYKFIPNQNKQRSDAQQQRDIQQMNDLISQKKTFLKYLTPVTYPQLIKIEEDYEQIIEFTKRVIDQVFKGMSSLEQYIGKAWSTQTIQSWKLQYVQKLKILVMNLDKIRIGIKQKDKYFRQNKMDQQTQTQKPKKTIAHKLQVERLEKQLQTKTKLISELEEEISKLKISEKYMQFKKIEEDKKRQALLVQQFVQKSSKLEVQLEDLKTETNKKQKIILSKLNITQQKLQATQIQLQKTKVLYCQSLKVIQQMKITSQDEIEEYPEINIHHPDQIIESSSNIQSLKSFQSKNDRKKSFVRMSKQLKILKSMMPNNRTSIAKIQKISKEETNCPVELKNVYDQRKVVGNMYISERQTDNISENIQIQYLNKLTENKKENQNIQKNTTKVTTTKMTTNINLKTSKNINTNTKTKINTKANISPKANTNTNKNKLAHKQLNQNYGIDQNLNQNQYCTNNEQNCQTANQNNQVVSNRSLAQQPFHLGSTLNISERNTDNQKLNRLSKNQIQFCADNQNQKGLQFIRKGNSLQKGMIHKGILKKGKFDYLSLKQEQIKKQNDTQKIMNRSPLSNQISIRKGSIRHTPIQSQQRIQQNNQTDFLKVTPLIGYSSIAIQTISTQTNNIGSQTIFLQKSQQETCDKVENIDMKSSFKQNKKYILPSVSFRSVLTKQTRNQSLENTMDFSSQYIKTRISNKKKNMGEVLQFFNIDMGNNNNMYLNAINRSLHLNQDKIQKQKHQKVSKQIKNSFLSSLECSTIYKSKLPSVENKNPQNYGLKNTMINFLKLLKSLDKGEYEIFMKSLVRLNKYSTSQQSVYEFDLLDLRLSNYFKNSKKCDNCYIFRIFIEKLHPINEWIDKIIQQHHLQF